MDIPRSLHSAIRLIDLDLNLIPPNDASTASIRKFNEIASSRHLKLNSVFRDHFSGSSNAVQERTINQHCNNLNQK